MDSSSSPQPPPLPAHIVSFILSYISPLDHPLPPHILSTPLRQRHHFLGLGSKFESDEDITTYLSWQSMSGNDNEINTIADILSTLPSPENCDPLSIYQTKYSFDGEAVYAHAYAPSLNPDLFDHLLPRILSSMLTLIHCLWGMADLATYIRCTADHSGGRYSLHAKW